MKGYITIQCLCCGVRMINIDHIQQMCDNEHTKPNKKARFMVNGTWHETNKTHAELEALITAATV